MLLQLRQRKFWSIHIQILTNFKKIIFKQFRTFHPSPICTFHRSRKTCTWLDKQFRTFHPSLHESAALPEGNRCGMISFMGKNIHWRLWRYWIGIESVLTKKRNHFGQILFIKEKEHWIFVYRKGESEINICDLLRNLENKIILKTQRLLPHRLLYVFSTKSELYSNKAIALIGL